MLLGGDGDELLIGSAGRDFLVGGIGSSTRQDELASVEAVVLGGEGERDWLGSPHKDDSTGDEWADQAILDCALAAALDGGW